MTRVTDGGRARALAPSAALVAALVGALAVLLGSPLGAAPARAADIDKQQQQIAAALKAAGADLDASSARTQAAAKAYATVQAQLTAAQNALATARNQLVQARGDAKVAAANADAAREALAGARAAVTAAQGRVEAKQAELEALIRARYESGPAEDVTLLLGTGDPGAYLERAGLLQTVVRGRNTQLVSLDGERAQLAASQQVVRDRSAVVLQREKDARAALERVSALVARSATAEKQLAELAAERNRTLQAASAALASDRARVAQLQQESAQIAALIRARDSVGTTASARASAAGLIDPVSGPITSGFGYRLDPVTHQYALHAGIDFGVGMGTPIHAAKSGTVLFAGQETGYGNYTCLDHGGGFSTCYAHQSQILVHVGETVAQGQVIGLSGNSGYSTGPHLHFETRVNGDPENPLGFL